MALGQLLTMKAALDSHQRELEWDLDSALQQCEAQATRAIQEAEFLCTATIKEVEAHHVAIIKDAEDHHVATIKEAEDWCTAWVQALQSHREDILKFEHEALEKEEHSCLSFLEACGAALRACPIEAHRVLLYPLRFLMGNILPASQLTATPQLAPPVREPPLTVSLPQHLNCHLLPQELNGSTTHLGRRLLDQLLLQKSLLIRSRKGEAPLRAQRNPLGGLLLGHLPSSGHQADVYWGTSPYFWPGGIPWFLQSFSGDDHLCQTHGVQDLWSQRGLGQTERPQVCSLCNKGFAEGSLVFPPCVPFRVTKGYGTKRVFITLMHPATLQHLGVEKKGKMRVQLLIICRQCTTD